eukprot:TRINITY_DN12746_c0_g1_i1.p1 TRINITY_DN12746_c0_g1~~TRINITY_DN12746_c0_g1_i1.p1  ORF type:complete len:1641 (-),score=380.61 TRINITY_DN12746_c0_g1_i1:224-5146(-)
MGEIFKDPGEKTFLYIMYVDSIQLAPEMADLAQTSVVVRWYVDNDNACSNTMQLSGTGPSRANYCAFMVCSFDDPENRGSKPVTMTLSPVDGQEHLGVAFLDLTSFSVQTQFKEARVELQSQAGVVATVDLHTASQERWVRDAPIVTRDDAYFVDHSVDPQAAYLIVHIVKDTGEEDAAAQQAMEAQTRAAQEEEARQAQQQQEEERRKREQAEEEERKRQAAEKKRQEEEEREREREREKEKEREREKERQRQESSEAQAALEAKAAQEKKRQEEEERERQRKKEDEAKERRRREEEEEETARQRRRREEEEREKEQEKERERERELEAERRRRQEEEEERDRKSRQAEDEEDRRRREDRDRGRGGTSDRCEDRSGAADRDRDRNRDHDRDRDRDREHDRDLDRDRDRNRDSSKKGAKNKGDDRDRDRDRDFDSDNGRSDRDRDYRNKHDSWDRRSEDRSKDNGRDRDDSRSQERDRDRGSDRRDRDRDPRDRDRDTRDRDRERDQKFRDRDSQDQDWDRDRNRDRRNGNDRDRERDGNKKQKADAEEQERERRRRHEEDLREQQQARERRQLEEDRERLRQDARRERQREVAERDRRNQERQKQQQATMARIAYNGRNDSPTNSPPRGGLETPGGHSLPGRGGRSGEDTSSSRLGGRGGGGSRSGREGRGTQNHDGYGRQERDGRDSRDGADRRDSRSARGGMDSVVDQSCQSSAPSVPARSSRHDVGTGGDAASARTARPNAAATTAPQATAGQAAVAAGAVTVPGPWGTVTVVEPGRSSATAGVGLGATAFGGGSDSEDSQPNPFEMEGPLDMPARRRSSHNVAYASGGRSGAASERRAASGKNPKAAQAPGPEVSMAVRLKQLRAMSNNQRSGLWTADQDYETVGLDGVTLDNGAEVPADQAVRHAVTDRKQHGRSGPNTPRFRRSSPRAQQSPVVTAEAAVQAGPGPSTRAAAEVLAAALADVGVSATTSVGVPLATPRGGAHGVGGVGVCNGLGTAPVAAVEECVMRLLVLQRELSTNNGEDDPGRAYLADAAAGLAPRMLGVLEAARTVCEANKAKLKVFCQDRDLDLDQLGGGGTGYLQPQISALDKLRNQYTSLLNQPPPGSGSGGRIQSMSTATSDVGIGIVTPPRLAQGSGSGGFQQVSMPLHQLSQHQQQQQMQPQPHPHRDGSRTPPRSSVGLSSSGAMHGIGFGQHRLQQQSQQPYRSGSASPRTLSYPASGHGAVENAASLERQQMHQWGQQHVSMQPMQHEQQQQQQQQQHQQYHEGGWCQSPAALNLAAAAFPLSSRDTSERRGVASQEQTLDGRLNAWGGPAATAAAASPRQPRATSSQGLPQPFQPPSLQRHNPRAERPVEHNMAALAGSTFAAAATSPERFVGSTFAAAASPESGSSSSRGEQPPSRGAIAAGMFSDATSGASSPPHRLGGHLGASPARAGLQNQAPLKAALQQLRGVADGLAPAVARRAASARGGEDTSAVPLSSGVGASAAVGSRIGRSRVQARGGSGGLHVGGGPHAAAGSPSPEGRRPAAEGATAPSGAWRRPPPPEDKYFKILQRIQAVGAVGGGLAAHLLEGAGAGGNAGGGAPSSARPRSSLQRKAQKTVESESDEETPSERSTQRSKGSKGRHGGWSALVG